VLTGGSCRLRPATRADLPELAALERGVFTDPWTIEQLGAAMDWPGAIALVAEDAGAIVGYVLGRLIVDEAEILSIATRVERRREGIGRRLLDAVMAALTQRGAQAVWLEVRMSNGAAREMYQSAGFAAAGVRRGYYRLPTEDALVLRRELGRPASEGASLH
jgi:ribosomal-protein-alanine N-acetyltransferase